MLIVIMLNVVMLNVVVLNTVMMSVVAPLSAYSVGRLLGLCSQLFIFFVTYVL